MFQLAKQKLSESVDHFQQNPEQAFDEAAPQMIDSLIYAKMPPHLKKSINQTYLKKYIDGQIVRHSEKKLELNELNAYEAQVITQKTVVKQQSNSQNTVTNYRSEEKNSNHSLNNTLQNDQYQPHSRRVPKSENY